MGPQTGVCCGGGGQWGAVAKLLPGVQDLIMLMPGTKERLHVQPDQSVWLTVLVEGKTHRKKSPFSFQRVGRTSHLSPVRAWVTK